MRPNVSGSIEMLVDRFAQGPEADWFPKHSINRSRPRPGDFNQGTEPGEENDGKSGVQLFDQFGSLIAAHLRHGSIEENDVEAFLLGPSNGFSSACRDRNLMPVATQVVCYHLTDSFVVVNRQNVEL